MENLFLTKLKLKDKIKQDKILDNVDEERPMALNTNEMSRTSTPVVSQNNTLTKHRLRIAEMGLGSQKRTIWG